MHLPVEKATKRPGPENRLALTGDALTALGLGLAVSSLFLAEWSNTAGSTFPAMRERVLDPGTPAPAVQYFTWGLPALIGAVAILTLFRRRSLRPPGATAGLSALVGLAALIVGLVSTSVAFGGEWGISHLWTALTDSRLGLWTVTLGFLLMTLGPIMSAARSSAQSVPLRGPAIALLAVAVISVGLAGWQLREGLSTADRPADPDLVALPDAPENSPEVAGYLAGDGAVLIKFVNGTALLTAEPDEAECVAFGERFDGIAGPDELLAVAGQIPDPDLRDAALNHVLTVSTFLSACGTSRPQPLDEITFTRTVFERMLSQVGAR